ncbi:MAG: gamma-mobile-trio protein GmtX [Sulfitobacter sp.]|uniref:gamma-mobile-trio protein GmtX n=1 Tax=Alphaproteobacteria TaxID=28211 RepID=UPI003265ED4E
MTEITKGDLGSKYPRAHTLYSTIKGKTRNTLKQKGLDNLWEVLRRQDVSNSTDFTVATIGAQTAALGGPTAQTIRNANGADYKAIINAFAKEAGGVTKGKPPKQGSEFEVALSAIDDRATRHMVKLIIQENKSLRNENNILKNALTKEALPIQASPRPVPRKTPSLDSTMVEGISQFLSPAEMQNKGWKVNEHGAIMDAQGNEIAPVGFYDALTGLLDSTSVD